MSTAVKIALLLMFINLGVWFVGGMNLYTGEVTATNPENLPKAVNPSKLGGGWSLLNFLGIAGISGILSALGAKVAGADPVRIAAIAIFGSVFWLLFFNSVGLMDSLNLPSQFITILGLVYGVVFFMAIVQMASGTSIQTIR